VLAYYPFCQPQLEMRNSELDYRQQEYSSGQYLLIKGLNIDLLLLVRIKLFIYC
jgi:hypothetical protein